MEEVELRDYLKIILKRKKIIIFTVLIFIITNFAMSFSLIKNSFKATGTLLLPDYDQKGQLALLELYQGYNIISAIKEELKLKYLPSAPNLKIIKNNILEIAVFNSDPKVAIMICNAFLSKIENIEKQKYEKLKYYFQEQIIIMEEEIAVLKKGRDGMHLDSPAYFLRLHQMELRVDEFRGALKTWNDKLNSLIEPVILTPPFLVESINLSRGRGMILSGFIGLIIGILIAFIIEYLKFKI